VGWKYKSEDITNSINDQAKGIYLDKFQKIHTNSPSDASRVFIGLYHRRFGRRHFLFPIILTSFIVIIGSSLIAESITSSPSNIWKSQLSLSSAAVAALAGSYMWVVSDFISRSRRMDFSPAGIMWGDLRLVISVPLGLSLGSIVPGGLDFIAFALGAFPLTTIQVALRQLSYKRLGLELGPTEKNELLLLDGIDKPLAERLANEDITSIVQLAYCDPIQLTMRTNLSFNSVVDLVSQALAWVYIADRLTVIRPLGIRGAYEIHQLIADLGTSNDPHAKDAAEKIIPAIATKLELDNDKLWFVLRQIANDPYTDFIYSTWS
jgi:hypothetical protein